MQLKNYCNGIAQTEQEPNDPRRRWILLAILGLAVSVFAPVSARAASTEAKVKTAYLYTFMRSVTWPANAFDSDTAPIVVSILGDDPLEGLLDMVAAKKTINKRKITINRLTSPADYKPSHILYVPGTPSADVRKAILDQTNDSSALVVGEVEGFAKEGASVNFFLDSNGTVGYEVNQAATAANGLKLDEKIVKMGVAVTP